MLTHAQIWRAIDRLAESRGLTASGLARLAGLDPTTFNLSKRNASDGSRPRWPSTESLAKVLAATRTRFADFAAWADGAGAGRSVPLIGFAEAGADGYFDDAGFPAGAGWEEVRFPGVEDDNAYALEISGRSMEPVYREGDRVVAAPGEAPRRGDRVVVKLRSGEVTAKQLGRVTERSVELVSLNPDYADRSAPTDEIVWMARIVWASQ